MVQRGRIRTKATLSDVSMLEVYVWSCHMTYRVESCLLAGHCYFDPYCNIFKTQPPISSRSLTHPYTQPTQTPMHPSYLLRAYSHLPRSTHSTPETECNDRGMVGQRRSGRGDPVEGGWGWGGRILDMVFLCVGFLLDWPGGRGAVWMCCVVCRRDVEALE